MYIFYRPAYRSEATEFIDQLKVKKPELAAQQDAGRALLWNKTVDREAWNGYRAEEVPQQAYVYQTTVT